MNRVISRVKILNTQSLLQTRFIQRFAVFEMSYKFWRARY